MNDLPSRSAGQRVPFAIAASVTIVATVALYWPALGTGFLGDDFMILHRLRGLAHASDILRFFRGEFFEYYRPLAFVSHAIDWGRAGQNSRAFHFTNLLIHAVSILLVFLIGLRVSPRPLAGLLAAALFALHASNNEAVVWISARFDLLATCFALGALYCMMRAQLTGQAGAAALFFLALLSKEAAVALPVAAAAWFTFRLHATTARTVILIVPWMAALAGYSALRHVAGGVSAVGGASRLPKLVAFLVCLGVIVALSSERWIRVREWLRPRRTQSVAVAVALALALLLAAALSSGGVGSLAREKLAVAGFAIFYLLSPVLGPGESVFSDPTAPAAWLSGAAALLAVVVVIAVFWRRLLDDDRYWFLGALLAATLLPISALTEGKRYLYLPSAAMSLLLAVLVTELPQRGRRVAFALAAAVLAVSTVQVAFRIQDWRWAGQMTSAGGQLVDSTLAPSCGTGHVVFLTSPVAMRGVYSHFYYETFEIPRGCMPEVFQVLVRVVRVETPIHVTWDGPDRIVITASPYRDNFVLSRDLREFDLPLRAGAPVSLDTPLGHVSAQATGNEARVVLSLAPAVQREPPHFFFYADGAIAPLGQSR
jgi:hypothetical protein